MLRPYPIPLLTMQQHWPPIEHDHDQGRTWAAHGTKGLKDLYPDSREWFMRPWNQNWIHVDQTEYCVQWRAEGIFPLWYQGYKEVGSILSYQPDHGTKRPRGINNFVDTHGANGTNEQCHSLNLEFFPLNRDLLAAQGFQWIQWIQWSQWIQCLSISSQCITKEYCLTMEP